MTRPITAGAFGFAAPTRRARAVPVVAAPTVPAPGNCRAAHPVVAPGSLLAARGGRRRRGCATEVRGQPPRVLRARRLVRVLPLGAVQQPLIDWVNRPTFQQVVEVQGHR